MLRDALQNGLAYAAFLHEVLCKLRCQRNRFLPNRELTPAMLTIGSLSRDIEQIKYLQSCRVSEIDLENMIANYERVHDTLRTSGDQCRRRLNEEEGRLVGAPMEGFCTSGPPQV